jgi:hypothetical protein
MTGFNFGRTAIAFAVAGLAFGSFAISGANAGATVQKCKKMTNSHGDMMCECLVRTDARKKPKYVYFTSAGANCTFKSGNPPTISMVEPGKKAKSLSYASNSSSILSIGLGTTFGFSGGLVVGNSNSNTGSIGSNSANAGGGADGAAGGVGSGGFSAGGAGGSTHSSASTN